MKSIKIFLMAAITLFSISVTAQNNWKTRATNGKLIEAPKLTVITTTNATATHVDSIVIADNTAGIITIEGVGAVPTTGKAITGVLVYRYSKSAGTLTIGTVTSVVAIVADTEVSGGTFALAATASNNAQLKATGKASTTVRWRFNVFQTPH